MDATTQDPIDAAAAWHARIDAPDMDWERFGDWLAHHPTHRAAYDAIALLDAEIGEAAPAIAALLPANDDVLVDHHHRLAPPLPPRASRWRWVATATGGALAAGLALLFVAPQLGGDDAQVYVTNAGATRALTLADGSAMRIDRGSRVSVAGGTTPLITLASGAASFTVRHDPSRTLIVRAGDYDIRDVGTRFSVVNAGGRLSVAVAEGEVSVAPHTADGSTPATVTAGQRLDIDTATGVAARRRRSPTGPMAG